MQNMDSGIGSEFRKKCPIFGHLAMDLKIYWNIRYMYLSEIQSRFLKRTPKFPENGH